MGQHNNLHVHRWIAVAIFTLAILTSCTTPQQQLTDTADTVFLNGKVLTVDQSFSIAEAMAVKGERIIAVGSNDAVRAKAGASTRVIDLNGKTVIPGLIDNHMHFIRAVQRWNLQARIDGINKRSEALAAIAAKAASLPAGDWLMVQGGCRRVNLRTSRVVLPWKSWTRLHQITQCFYRFCITAFTPTL